MRNYTYRARNLTGRIVEGTIPANDQNAAYEQLTKDKLIPVEIHPAIASTENAMSRLFFERIRDEDVILFTRQLSTMLKAGIPVVQTIEILRDQIENKRFKQILTGVSRTLTAGSRLSEAMSEYPRVFAREYVSIVVSGETGGDLVKALSSIAQWMERELEIRTAIKSALRYPFIGLCRLDCGGYHHVDLRDTQVRVVFRQFHRCLAPADAHTYGRQQPVPAFLADSLWSGHCNRGWCGVSHAG